MNCKCKVDSFFLRTEIAHKKTVFFTCYFIGNTKGCKDYYAMLLLQTGSLMVHKAASYALFISFKKTAIANSQLQFLKAIELFIAIALEEILGLMIRLIGEVIQI